MALMKEVHLGKQRYQSLSKLQHYSDIAAHQVAEAVPRRQVPTLRPFERKLAESSYKVMPKVDCHRVGCGALSVAGLTNPAIRHDRSTVAQVFP